MIIAPMTPSLYSQLLFRLRLEYSHAMTPRAFYANLFTPKAQERALAWNGALIVRPTRSRPGHRVPMPLQPVDVCCC